MAAMSQEDLVVASTKFLSEERTDNDRDRDRTYCKSSKLSIRCRRRLGDAKMVVAYIRSQPYQDSGRVVCVEPVLADGIVPSDDLSVSSGFRLT